MAGLSNDIIAGIAGDPCSAGAPGYDMALRIHGEDAIGHHIQHVAQNGRIFRKSNSTIEKKLGVKDKKTGD